MTEPKDSLFSFLSGSSPLGEWLAALIALIAVWGGLYLIKMSVLSRLKKVAARTTNDLDDVLVSMLDGVSRTFYLIAGLYAASLLAPLPAALLTLVRIIFVSAAAVESVRALSRLVEYGVCKYLDCAIDLDGDGQPDPETAQRRTIARAATSLVKVTLWVLAFLVVLSNLGVNVTSLVAGVGIGGIAIALAVQNILSDLFSSFSIYADKPFEVGDFIIIGSDMGTVERIGLKSTRLRTLQGEQMVISNRELISARIQNFRRMEKRRVVVNFGVVYGTTEDKLKRIPQIVRQAVEAADRAELDRCHLASFGPSSLDFEAVFLVNSSDYNVYMDIRQQINLDLYRAFAKEGIEFAYPTQTVILEKAKA